MDHVLAALKASDLLGVLSARTRLWLSEQGGPLLLDPEGTAFHEGQAADAVLVLLDGELQQTSARSPADLGRRVRPISLLHELETLEGGSHSWTAVAVRRANLWRLPRQAVLKAFEQEPVASWRLVATLSSRVRAVTAQLDRNAKLNLSGRVAQFLLDQQNSRGMVALTQTEIAARLHASREKVNRKLHLWAAEGWVELTRSGVRLKALEELQALLREEQQR